MMWRSVPYARTRLCLPISSSHSFHSPHIHQRGIHAMSSKFFMHNTQSRIKSHSHTFITSRPWMHESALHLNLHRTMSFYPSSSSSSPSGSPPHGGASPSPQQPTYSQPPPFPSYQPPPSYPNYVPPQSQSQSQWILPDSLRPPPSEDPTHISAGPLHLVHPIPSTPRQQIVSGMREILFLLTSSVASYTVWSMGIRGLVMLHPYLSPELSTHVTHFILTLPTGHVQMMLSAGIIASSIITYTMLGTIWNIKGNRVAANRSIWYKCLIFLLIAAASHVVITLISVISPAIEDPALLAVILRPHLFDLIDICLFGPIMEEWLMRGLFFARLLASAGVLPGYTLSATLFGIAHHSEDSSKILPSTLMGLALCLSYHLSGTLLVPIALHILNNTFAALSLYSIRPCQSNVTREELEEMMNLYQQIDMTSHHLEVQCRTIIHRYIYPILDSELFDENAQLTSTFRQICHEMFQRLDEEGKGYLTPQQWGIIELLQSVNAVFYRLSYDTILETTFERVAPTATLTFIHSLRPPVVTGNIRLHRVVLLQLEKTQPQLYQQIIQEAEKEYQSYMSSLVSASYGVNFGSIHCTEDDFLAYMARTAICFPEDAKRIPTLIPGATLEQDKQH